ncbi:hypothetical protein GGF31_005331 [Allomyces arbusculus]|nr:hypothetical protein GGF31_005331 [Allomyces arbusculus]
MLPRRASFSPSLPPPPPAAAIARAARRNSAALASLSTTSSSSSTSLASADLAALAADPSRVFARRLSINPTDLRVLVVDADAAHARRVAAMLAANGYPAETVPDAAAALVALKRAAAAAAVANSAFAAVPRRRAGSTTAARALAVDSRVSRSPSPAQARAPGSRRASHDAGLPPHSLTSGGEREYALLVADMASASGTDLLKAVRSEPSLRHLPVIMLATADEMELAYACLRAGADDYMVKPVKPDAVRGVWRAVWRKRKEKTVWQLLDEERTRRESLETTIESLQDQVAAAVETPLSLITKTVTNLLVGNDAASLPPNAKAQLASVLTTLTASNLYRPALERAIRSSDLDAQARSWLAVEVLRDTPEYHAAVYGAPGSPAPAPSASPVLGARRARRGSTGAAAHAAARAAARRHRRDSVDSTVSSAASDVPLDAAPPGTMDEQWLLAAAAEAQAPMHAATPTLPAVVPEATHLPLLNSWNFDPWSYAHHELLVFLVDMFADLGLLEVLKVEPARFLEFLVAVEKGYADNPYHNFRHAFDVTQAAYLFLRTCCVKDEGEAAAQAVECEEDVTVAISGALPVPPTPTSLGYPKVVSATGSALPPLPPTPPPNGVAGPEEPVTDTTARRVPRLRMPPMSRLAAQQRQQQQAAARPTRAALLFTPLEQAAFLLACVCHDLHHDGKTNSYHIQAASALALLYNDQSPLENHHAHEAFVLLRKFDLLASLTRAEHAEVRKLIIRCILATDLAKHVDVMAKYNEIQPVDWTDAEHRARTLEMLIKCADVSNVVRPLHLARGWSDCIQAEMWAQGDLERSKGWTVSGFSDRTRPQAARMGLTFAEYMVAPLFRTMGAGVPRMARYLETIAVTRDYWAGLADAEAQAAAAAADASETDVTDVEEDEDEEDGATTPGPTQVSIPVPATPTGAPCAAVLASSPPPLPIVPPPAPPVLMRTTRAPSAASFMSESTEYSRRVSDVSSAPSRRGSAWQLGEPLPMPMPPEVNGAPPVMGVPVPPVPVKHLATRARVGGGGAASVGRE